MRIVAGNHRGRRIAAPAGPTVRPTADRVRESLFNVLAHNDWGPGDAPLLRDIPVVDAFAGPGALDTGDEPDLLGVEIASRTLAVGPEVAGQKSAQSPDLGHTDREGKIELPVVTVRCGRHPASHRIRHRAGGGDARRVESRQQHHGHDHKGRGDGRRRGVIQLHALDEVDVQQQLAQSLPQNVAKRNSDDGVHAGLG